MARALVVVNTLPYGRGMPPHLTPEDWIAAAFRRLGREGIAAVRVEAVARELGVSKGSFYWHFTDLSDLRRRMLDHWHRQASARILAMADAAGEGARERLSRLMELATSDLDAPYGGYAAEAAIRDWARNDPEAAEAQQRADALRLGYLQGLFAGAGASDPNRAARLVLMCYTGAIHLGTGDRGQLAGDLKALLAALLDRPEPKGQD